MVAMSLFRPTFLLFISSLPSSTFQFKELDLLFDQYKEGLLLSEDKQIAFQAALQRSENGSSIERTKRDMPTMYMGKKKKLRTCANMNGILGGSNAFNYISFVLAILTLIVQTNNNLNNNNNNLNQANINTASNNQANSNSNNNNANVINVMPPGKKKRRRRRSDKICVKSSSSSLSGELSLAAMFLVQSLLKSQHRSEKCGAALTCRAASDLESLGLGGRILSVAVRGASVLVNTSQPQCGEECEEEHHHHLIQCGLCGERLARPADIIDLRSDHSVSTTSLAMFGLESVRLSEFVNPAGRHFRSINVAASSCSAWGEWSGGSSWYPGHRWRVCRCPVCGQAVGWHWEAGPGEDWVGLRLDRVADWEDFLLGPLSHISQLLPSGTGAR